MKSARKRQVSAATAQFPMFAEDRSKLVRMFRENPRPWPDGIGAWYRAEDWDDSGVLLATGEARARALDPWANDRARGRPCPPMPGVTPQLVTTPPRVVTTSEPVTTSPLPGPDDRVTISRKKPKRDRAQYMRDRREKLEREAALAKEKVPKPWSTAP
jgi:hypothetical protein